MYPFTTNNQENDQKKSKNERDEGIRSSEAMQGDKAVISTIKELNELRAAKNR